MNKYLIWGAGVLVLIIAGYLLVANQGNKQTTTPSVTGGTPTPASSPSGQLQIEVGRVSLTKAGFEPQTLKVKAGTKVIWGNKSGQMGTVNSDVHPTHLLYPFLNLGSFDDGGSVSVTFDKTGTYTYHNHLNSSQTGTVIVE